MKNKRKTERITCLVPVEGKEDGIFGTTQTVDISKSGIGFISKKKVPLNKKIAIELDLREEEEDSVLVIGKVRWVTSLAESDNYRIGLSFTDVKHGSKSRLNKYFK